jgi:hypothetical protein
MKEESARAGRPLLSGDDTFGVRCASSSLITLETCTIFS